MKRAILVGALCALPALPVAAQAPTAPATPPQHTPEPELVFEREVYQYGAAGRRDPFRPLTSDNSAGPMFAELQLTGILYSTDPSQSRVSFRDSNKKQYRLRRGDTVGNATVVDIGRTRVVFSIREFGMTRTESLELKLTPEGASR
ncbi:MAG TPA: hypothetical protein VF035_02605 [Longimicrobiales bacterium]